MFNALSLAALGFLLGVRHALDADHVVAVTTILSRRPSVRHAGLVGALWGLGHTVTILLVGGAIVTFRLVVSPRLGLAMEFAVAVMLVVLGARSLRSVIAPGPRPDEPGLARPFLVGMMHGVAGSAAIALLVLATLGDPRWALAYLFTFGAGSAAGMVAVTVALAIPAAAAGKRFVAARRWLTITSGGASVALGVWIAFELSGPGGLFSAAPAWTPY